MPNLRKAALWAGTALLAAVASQGAMAQTQLSEQAVRKYMEYAWSLTPTKFTTPDGKTIEIDKKQRDANMVPVDTAREVIMAARLTAHAQNCELTEDQISNYRSLMLREEGKKRWSDQQLVYISQLHLTVVMLLNGKVKLVEQQGDKQVVLDDKEGKVKKLNADECKSVKDAIAAYVKAGPPLARAEAAPATAGAAAPAPVKK
jgi:outer membrane receptor for Fe3+-dicitrate